MTLRPDDGRADRVRAGAAPRRRPGPPPHAAGRAMGRELLEQLAQTRNHYAPGAAAAKLALLEALGRRRLRRAAELAALHGHLLFLTAFPDSAAVRAAAERALAAFPARLRRLAAKQRVALEDSGLVGSASRHSFEAPVARWLVERFGMDVEIDWRAVDDSSGIDFLLGLLTARAEQDGLESPALTTRQWLRRATGTARTSDLAWLVHQLRRQRATRAIWEALYDQAGVPLVWRPRAVARDVARGPTPSSAVYYRAGGLRRLPERPRRLIATPLETIERVDRRRGEELIDVTRATLTARCREVYAISHANPEEVYLADLGAGTALALIGVAPSRRLSLESNYGYLLLSNGVPVGYAGVTPLYRQANTGINVFEPFRGSEAAFLCAQTLRAFSTLFGVTRFVLNPYQIGAGNREAIDSGAFWFYYRLGFRPVAAELAALAAAERRRQLAQPRHRTDAATLRRLAQSDVELVLPGARARERFAEPWLAQLSLLASERLARAGGGSRAEAAERVAAEVARALGVRGRSRWAIAEQEAFTALAPLAALLDLRALGSRTRAALVRLLRAKGAAQEAPYVRAAAADRHFLPGLMAAARRACRGRGPPRAT